jgi:hypothetical protein
MKSNKEVFEEANKTILDCFTGVNGGVEYVNYVSLMRGYASDADQGNDAATRLVDLVEQFSKLVEILGKKKFD